MQSCEEILKDVERLLERYKKNKTMIPESDLFGKYRVAFEDLREQLKNRLEEYFAEYFAEGLTAPEDDDKEFWDTIDAMGDALRNSDLGKQIGKVVFLDYDLQTALSLAEEKRREVREEFYEPYYEKHKQEAAQR